MEMYLFILPLTAGLCGELCESANSPWFGMINFLILIL
jgi:hypothetical protein